MTYRMTAAHVEAKIGILNDMLGIASPAWNVPGTIELAGAYGGYAIHRVCTTGHGVTDLTGYQSLRECAAYVSGMIEAIRTLREQLARV